MDGEREAQALTMLTNVATPSGIEVMLSKVATMDGLKVHMETAHPMATIGIVYKSAIIARAMEIYSGYGNDAAGQVAKELGLSARAVNRYEQWWRGIFRPAIEERGDAASFILEEGIWYSTATAAAPKVEKTPLQLIDEATERKTSNPTFKPSDWRRELGVSRGDEGSTTSEGGKLWRLLKRLSKWDDSAIRDAVEGADPKKVLNDARDALVAAQTALNLLEERTKGRVEP